MKTSNLRWGNLTLGLKGYLSHTTELGGVMEPRGSRR